MIESRPLYSTIPLAAFTPAQNFTGMARRNDSILIISTEEFKRIPILCQLVWSPISQASATTVLINW
jgi:hypothetical protein